MKNFFSLQNPIAVILLSLIAVFGIYTSTLHAPMHFDGLGILVHHPVVTDLFGGMRHLDRIDSRKRLTLATFALNYYFHGTETFGYHLVNILLHLLTGIFLWRALLQLFQAPWFRRFYDVERLPAFAVFVVLIFFVHPLQTESVSYIWERSEILSGLFYAVVLWCYWYARVHHRTRFIAYAGLFWFIGLFAKGPVVTAPLLLILSEVFFFGGAERLLKRGWRKNMLSAVLAVVCVVGGIAALQKILGSRFGPSGTYFLTQLMVAGRYLQMTVIPVGQSLDHDIFWARDVWRPEIISSLVLYAVLFSSFIIMAKRFRLAMFGVFWYFIYLLPTSSLFAIATPMFEHRLYFSIPGFGICLTAVIFGLFSRKLRLRNSVMALVIAAFAVTAFARNQLWRSQTALIQDVIRKYPDNARAYWTLAGYEMDAGRLREAETALRKAIELVPDFSGPYAMLGFLLMQQGKERESLCLLKRAVTLNPLEASSYWGLAQYYKNVGRLALAADYIERGLKVSPRDTRLLSEEGDIFIRMGKFEKAERLIRQGLQIDRRDFQLRFRLGECLYMMRRYDEAEENFQWCLGRDPEFGPLYYGMGMIALRRNNLQKARKELEHACELEKRNPHFYMGLSKVYWAMGDRKRAEFYLDLSRTVKYRTEIPEYK